MFGGIRRTGYRCDQSKQIIIVRGSIVLKICHFGLFVKESRAAIETKPDYIYKQCNLRDRNEIEKQVHNTTSPEKSIRRTSKGKYGRGYLDKFQDQITCRGRVSILINSRVI